jgi:molecular chaperone DnaK
MYKAASPQAAPGAEAGASPAPGATAEEPKKKEEGVIDAEYVDVEDKK